MSQIRTAVCIDDSPTLLYTDRFLTKGKKYHVVVDDGPGRLVRVLDPDSVLVHEVQAGSKKVKLPDGKVVDEPTYRLTGNIAREEKRETIRCVAERFAMQPAPRVTMPLGFDLDLIHKPYPEVRA